MWHSLYILSIEIQLFDTGQQISNILTLHDWIFSITKTFHSAQYASYTPYRWRHFQLVEQCLLTVQYWNIGGGDKNIPSKYIYTLNKTIQIFDSFALESNFWAFLVNHQEFVPCQVRDTIFGTLEVPPSAWDLLSHVLIKDHQGTGT